LDQNKNLEKMNIVTNQEYE